jgi:hypothetical protein
MLFTRQGQEFQGQHQTDTKGAAFFVRERICGRCGGAGGSDKWKHTGWTCYDCGGSGRRGTETVKLYTADKLAKLNATAAKREEKRLAAIRTKQQIEATAKAARTADFEREHGELLAAAEALAGKDWFVDELAEKARRNSYMSEKQAEALAAAVAKIVAREAAKAASVHVGNIGERLTLNVSVVNHTMVQTDFGTMHIVAMRDAAGNKLVSKGKFSAERGDNMTIKGTVKDHSEYNGELQTIINRVAAQ